MKLEVKYRDIDTLDEYEGNAKLHPPEQIEQIAKSIKDFGFNDPIGIDEDGTIVEGHGRYRAAKLLGLKEVPTISLAHLNGAQQKAYIIAHNQLTMSTGFDMDLLKKEMQEIMDSDEDLIGAVGFDQEALAEMLLEVAGIEPSEIEGNIDEDEVPEVVEDEVVIEFGDLVEFQDGSRIICGDSTDDNTFDALMNGGKARMVNTDPPYGVAYQSDKFSDIANDDLTGDNLKDFLIQNFKLLNKYTIENPALYIYHASRTQREFEEALEIAGFRVKQQIIWVKNQFAFGRSDYHWKHEPLFYAVKEEKNCEWFGDRTKTTLFNDSIDLEELEREDLIELIESLKEQSTTWEVSKDASATYNHPTQKPVHLAKIAIKNSSQPGEIVLEPFSGSGSTLLGGFTTGRKVYAIEFEPKYVQVAIQRMVEFSGEEMITINGKVVNWYDYKDNR
jgi:DNA modification methylase